MILFRKFKALLQTLHTESFEKGQKGDAGIEANLSDSKAQDHWDTRPAIALMVAAVCLLMLHYLKFNSSFYAFLDLWFSQFSDDAATAINELRTQPFIRLAGMAWWSGWHVIAFVLIPLLTIKFIFKDSLGNYGLGIGMLRRDLKWYLLLIAPVLCFVFMVSFRGDFNSHYPFYKLAHRSWFDLITWEILYLLQFVCVEFFFRGFIVQACRPTFGVNAIFIMIVPYMMIHLPKLWLEATGSILFGLFLGILALHTRSIWGGVLVHISIALSMDIAALLQTRGLPQQWWP